jgi:hypothetical protein
LTFGIGCRRRDAEHLVRVGEPAVARRTPTRAIRTTGAHAQHRLERRELERRHTQDAADPLEDRSRHRTETAALQRGLELYLHEHAAQVRPPAGECAKLRDGVIERKIRALAGGVELDRRAHLRVVEREAPHRFAGGIDLALGDQAVGLRDVAHRLEGRAKERRAELDGAARRSPRRRRGTVELVTDQDSDDGPDPVVSHEGAEKGADQLAVPRHRFLDPPSGALQHRTSTDVTSW